MKLSRRVRRWIFWLGVIVVLVILVKVLSFLVNLTLQLIGVLIAAVVLFILYQYIKSRWL
jgi:hypothetical protein